MTPDELLSQFRRDVSDTAKPYLWSDGEVYFYMNSAYRSFVRHTGGVADVLTSDVCEIPFAVGDQFIDLHKSILRINRASLASDGRKVEIKNINDMDTVTGEADYGQRPGIDMNSSGSVKYLVIGEQRDVGRLVYVPDTADTLKLQVFRMPLNIIVDANSSFDDIEEDHHEYLSLWMQHKAYSKHDADCFDQRMADLREKEFFNYCSGVKAQWDRYKSKVRVTRYGG